MFQKVIVGSAIILSTAFFSSCVSDDINKIDCTTSDLAITKSVTDATVCSPANGSITVSATGGKPPYTFSKDGVTFISGTEFTGLSAGTYTLTVKDANKCEKITTAEITLPSSSLTAESQNEVPDTECLTGNGSFTIAASGGSGTYQYKIGAGTFSASNSFTSLQTGSYQVTVKDEANCEFALNVDVARGSTGVSFQNDIKPILEVNCIKSGCHNGDNGSERNWSVFSNVKTKAAGIKTRTGNKSMPKDKANENPPGLPQNQIDLIACWVDDGALDN
ncbi:MAG: SprB repeat-containing protein [Chryseolinea sp.]